MTEHNPPLFLQNRTDHTAENDRMSFESLVGGREGVVGSGDLNVTANGTPNMTVNVAAGRAAIDGDDNVNQGFYLVWNDAAVNLAIAAADATNARHDLVVARVRDAFYTGATNAWDLFVVTGTPAGVPADPATPNNSLVLARIQVNASPDATIIAGDITDLRQRTSALGGILPATATAVPGSPSQGQAVYVTTASLPSGAVAPQTSGRPNAPGLYIQDARWDPPWNLPWGIMGYSTVTSSQGSITTAADITGMAVTFTAVANRRIRVSAGLPYSLSAADNVTQLAIQESIVQLGRGLTHVRVSGSGITTNASALVTPTAGSHTYKCSLAVLVGAGTATTSPAANDPAWILVEDIGPNGQPA